MHACSRILTDKAIIARHLLPSFARLDRVVEVHCVMRLEGTGGRERGDLDLHPFLIFLAVALPLLVLMALLLCTRGIRLI